MRPPICRICHKELEDLEDSGLIYFKKRQSDLEWDKCMDREEFVKERLEERNEHWRKYRLRTFILPGIYKANAMKWWRRLLPSIGSVYGVQEILTHGYDGKRIEKNIKGEWIK